MTQQAGTQDRFLARTGLCLLPILVWALHFGVVYGGEHVTCAAANAQLRQPLVQMLVIGATAIGALVIAGTGLGAGHWLRLVSHPNENENLERFLEGVIRSLALLAFIAVIWAGSAALILPVCASR